MKIACKLPKRELSNAELSVLYPGWSADKILAKTGIAVRHVADGCETAGDLAELAARKLFKEKNVDPAAIDFILLCTQSPDYKLPSTACILQHKLGIPTSAGALDYDLGCSGYVYGLALAKGLIAGCMAKRVLLLTAETYTKYIHPMDKSARTIFGDGAAATLIDDAVASQIGQFVFGTDGSGAEMLMVETGGTRAAVDPSAEEIADGSGNLRTRNHLHMVGADIFNFTLDVVPGAIDEICEKNGVSFGDIDLFVFHQANRFMLETLRKVTGIPADKFYIDLKDVGNTVSSTIPIALLRAEKSGVLHEGMKVMVMGFGVGLSWGATIIHW